MAAHSRPLHLQTIDSLFAELIGGASVSVGEDGTEFSLSNADSRAILNWYRLNRAKWAGNVMTQDVEALVSAILTSPPTLPIPEIVKPKAGRKLRLVKVTAHRFGGLHAYGTAEEPPPDFEFSPDKPITLFEGWNGAGKTSILNSIIWCLTGSLLRPQRQPESGLEEFDSSFVRSEGASDETTSHSLTPITPLPNPDFYVPPVDKPIPIDSWVELVFVDQDGNELPPIRRTQLRNSRGRVSETPSGFEALGVDPIAFQLGTTMPAMLQFLRVGSTSDLGLAAARLTGLAEISALAKHAGKVKEKLKGDFKKNREKEIEGDDSSFQQARTDLQSEIDSFAEMAPTDPLPAPSGAKDVEQKLAALEAHFDALKAKTLAAAKSILGPDFDPTDKSERDNLEASIGPAQGQLKAMAQLPTVRRIRALGDLSDADWARVNKLVTKLHAEANILAELSNNPALERRKQLYARIANWISDGNDHDPTTCAVCSRSLAGITDPLTSQLVSDHIVQITDADHQLLSQTKQKWATHWAGYLTTNIPNELQPELSKDLPATPGDLIRETLVEDLFLTDAFSETLASLKAGVQLLCDQELVKLPKFTEPSIKALPKELGNITSSLEAMSQRLARAQAFADWRKAHGQTVAQITKSIVGGSSSTEKDVTNASPIADKLSALASIVKGTEPLNVALKLCHRMSEALQKRRTKEQRLSLYTRAITALDSVIELGSLSEKQVEELRKLLHKRTIYWRDKCYHNSFPMAGHALRDTSMDSKGVLDLQVGFSTATAPAQHISNSSALRASLMGFFLAFWEHVLKERGGIALLVLDDPQELLDHDNKEKLARLLPELVKGGGQIVLATYDRFFARAAVAAGRKYASIEHRSVHPVNPCRKRLETAAAVEELDIKRSAYEVDKDNAARAQDFANEVRSFLEARLSDLFDDPAYPAHSAPSKAPTLVDHLGHLRALTNSPPNALFKSKTVRDFCESKALAQGAECLRVLNTSHHNKTSLSAGDVYAILNDFESVLNLMEKMHIEFRHWRWQEPLQPATSPTNVVPFKPASVSKFKATVYPDLAAFTATSQHDTQEDVLEEIDETWFADKTLFLIRKDNLGFAVPDGCIAIAESTSYDGRDHNLVIARQKGHLLARRLFRPPHSDQLALAAEAPDPRNSKPTLLFTTEDIALHRIVGMLTEQPAPPLGRGEAIEIQSAKSLANIRAAYRVREDSGIPLALPGQIVLGGEVVERDQLHSTEGTLVALGLDDGSNVFKRIGESVPGSNGKLWQFESVGGLGKSLIVSLAEPDEEADAPKFIRARKIVGVLYT